MAVLVELIHSPPLTHKKLINKSTHIKIKKVTNEETSMAVLVQLIHSHSPPHKKIKLIN
jgi:hypothetical protein